MDKEVFDQRSVDEWLKEAEEKWNKLSPEEQEARLAAAKAEQERLSKMTLPEILAEAEQALAKSLGKPDWTYRDLPRMTPENRDALVKVIGEDEIFWITIAEYGDGTVRGQILISPIGMEALRQFSTGIRQ